MTTGGLALRNPKNAFCISILSIRRGHRLAGFHEADMIDLTDQEARQEFLDKINRVVANLGAEAGRKTIEAEHSAGGEGPEAREAGRNKLRT